MSKVVSLHNIALPINEPDKELVEVCEELLAHDKSGEMIGLAFARVRRNPDRVGTGWYGQASKEDMHSGAHTLCARIDAAMLARLEDAEG